MTQAVENGGTDGTALRRIGDDAVNEGRQTHEGTRLEEPFQAEWALTAGVTKTCKIMDEVEEKIYSRGRLVMEKAPETPLETTLRRIEEVRQANAFDFMSRD